LRRALVPHKSLSVKSRSATVLEEYDASGIGEAVSVETICLIQRRVEVPHSVIVEILDS